MQFPFDYMHAACLDVAKKNNCILRQVVRVMSAYRLIDLISKNLVTFNSFMNSFENHV